MLYITQTVILYYHLVLTKGTLWYADLYNHEKDQLPLLYMKKVSEIHNIFIEKSCFCFYCAHLHMRFFSCFTHTSIDQFGLALMAANVQMLS